MNTPFCNSVNIKSEKINKNGYKSLCGLYDNVKPEMLQYSNEVVYKSSYGPLLKHPKDQWTYINKDTNIGLQKNARYSIVEDAQQCSNKKTEAPTGRPSDENKYYTNYHDARLLNNITGIRTYLGERPYDADHNTDINNFPPKMDPSFDINNYPDYENINKGNNIYKHSNLGVFYSPLFTMRGNVDHVLQSTPMGKVYPKYVLDIDNKTMNNYSNNHALNDSNFFRESLISTYNVPFGRDYTLRYYSLDDQ